MPNWKTRIPSDCTFLPIYTFTVFTRKSFGCSSTTSHSFDFSITFGKPETDAKYLQTKVDRKSYLLVDANSWEIGKPPIEFQDIQDISKTDDDDPYKYHGYHSFSEARLDLGTSRSPGATNLPFAGTNGFQKSLTWKFSFKPERMVIQDEGDTYKSASVLSLVTFTSLLIEFVVRLGNLVVTFEELNETTKFKAPMADLGIFTICILFH
ncbi:unnamed protein product [Lactuca virosa]|uniref:Uncharacterized protein n=1 Tax=Lactuca virosa TaxID=75947 RepID=A0AAU9P9E7_9ASTR|nr:unnamed protein product [Lactuca virosa]